MLGKEAVDNFAFEGPFAVKLLLGLVIAGETRKQLRLQKRPASQAWQTAGQTNMNRAR